MLDWKLFLLFHTMQKFSTLAVDWLEDTHEQGWGTPFAPVWPGLDSGPDPVCDASLFVIYSAPRCYSLGTLGFSSHQKPKLVVQLCSTKFKRLSLVDII